MTDETKTLLEKMVSRLHPQPVKEQMGTTMSLKEAEQLMGLKVNNVYNLRCKVAIMRGKDGPYYEPLWAYDGHVYIRLSYGGELVDVFLT